MGGPRGRQHHGRILLLGARHLQSCDGSASSIYSRNDRWGLQYKQLRRRSFLYPSYHHPTAFADRGAADFDDRKNPCGRVGKRARSRHVCDLPSDSLRHRGARDIRRRDADRQPSRYWTAFRFCRLASSGNFPCFPHWRASQLAGARGQWGYRDLGRLPREFLRDPYGQYGRLLLVGKRMHNDHQYGQRGFYRRH